MSVMTHDSSHGLTQTGMLGRTFACCLRLHNHGSPVRRCLFSYLRTGREQRGVSAEPPVMPAMAPPYANYGNAPVQPPPGAGPPPPVGAAAAGGAQGATAPPPPAHEGVYNKMMHALGR
jgi:hypothetical protein